MKNLTRIAFVVLGMMIANCAYAQASNHEGGEQNNKNQMTAAEFHHLALRSMAVEHLNSKSGKRRDKNFITAKECPGDTLYERCTDKWGFSWYGALQYQGGEGANGIGFSAGASYSTVGENGFGFRGILGLGASRTAFNDNSLYPDESFIAFTATTMIGFTAFKLDDHDVNKIWINGGIEWNWAPSESKAVEMEDGGKQRLHTKTFTGHPIVTLEWEHRFFNSGNSVSVYAGVKQDRSIRQSDGQFVKPQFIIGAKFSIGGWRHKTRNTGSQLW